MECKNLVFLISFKFFCTQNKFGFWSNGLGNSFAIHLSYNKIAYHASRIRIHPNTHFNDTRHKHKSVRRSLCYYDFCWALQRSKHTHTKKLSLKHIISKPNTPAMGERTKIKWGKKTRMTKALQCWKHNVKNEDKRVRHLKKNIT